LRVSIDSPGKKACNYLREKDDQKNDASSYPQNGDAQRAAFLALVPPPIQLNESYGQQGYR
jgi:hypothetical protein